MKRNTRDLLGLAATAAAASLLAGCGLGGASSYADARELFGDIREHTSCEPEGDGDFAEEEAGEVNEELPAVTVIETECYGQRSDDSFDVVVFVAQDEAEGDDLVEASKASFEDKYLVVGDGWVVLVDDERGLDSEQWASTVAEELDAELIGA